MCCIVKEFCCGCTLRHGAITAAVLNGIVTVFLIAAGAQVLFSAGKLQDAINAKDVYADLSNNVNSDLINNSKENQKQAVTVANISGGIILTMGLISAVIFACLVAGIVKNIAGLVIPWLVGCMIEIVLSCICVLIMMIFGGFISLISLPMVAFYMYLWIVVLNYHRELQNSPPAYSEGIKA